MRKKTVYVETSVWNFLFAEDAPYRRAAAEVLIDSPELYEVYISVTVVDEIAECPGERGEMLVDILTAHAPIRLEPDPEVESLAGLYVSKGVIPVRYKDDASHIAYASFYGLDYLASYNFRHIVKLKTKNEVTDINSAEGYETPLIISPEELVDFEE